jgi:tRNA-guanine family transglycosylase
MLSATLLSLHNLHTLLQLARDLQQSIIEGSIDSFVEQFFGRKEELEQQGNGLLE